MNTPSPGITAPDLQVARLRRLDSCAISDAFDQLGLPAAISGIAPRAARRRIAGRVVTVKLAGGPRADGSRSHLCTLAIESAQHGDIIVVEQSTGIDAAGWGGILSAAAHVRGLSGAIIEGPARDLDEAAEIGFPVYSRSATSRTARGRVHEVATGTPVEIGGVIVATGDYVVADTSGVAFIPASLIDGVLEAAESIAARETHMTQAVLSGEPVSTVMSASYEEMLARR